MSLRDSYIDLKKKKSTVRVREDWCRLIVVCAVEVDVDKESTWLTLMLFVFMVGVWTAPKGRLESIFIVLFVEFKDWDCCDGSW